MHDFQIGDRVRIKSEDELKKRSLWLDMIKCAGCETIITGVCVDFSDMFELEINNNFWWSKELFELITDEDSPEIEVASNQDILGFLSQEV